MVTYNHGTIYKWYNTNFINKYSTNKESITEENFSNILLLHSKEKRLTLLEKIIKNCIVNGCAEFCQISALFILNGNNSSIGFARSKIFLEQSSEVRGIFSFIVY